MAVSSVISRVCDLNKPLIQENLDHILVMGDSQGDQFDVAISHGNNPQSLTGGGIIGYFIRIESGKKIEDSDTVVITGSASGNIATVILPETCYTKPGRFVLTIKVSLEGRRHTVYIANGAIARSTTDSIVDPGHVIPDINELLGYISALEKAIDDAKKVVAPAEQATLNANNAAASANEAASNANQAAAKANLGASVANDAATNAVGATTKANNAAASANEAAAKASSAADRVDTSISSANTAATNANKAADGANTATTNANQATSKANEATTKANTAATEATEAATIAKKWGNVEVSVTILPEDGTAKCTVTDATTGKMMAFDIPRGYTGLTPNLTIGTVKTGLPGTDVIVTMTGSKENPVLNLTIPRGDTGSVENFPYATRTPLPSQEEGSVGTSDRVAREDHVHPLPEVGGRNILKNSKPNITESTYQMGDFYLTESPKQDDIYTVQIKGVLGDDRTGFYIYNSSNNVRLTPLEYFKDGIYRATFSWNLYRDSTTASNTFVRVYQQPNTGTSSSTIEWIKLEKGVVPTDWSPAPEDIIIPEIPEIPEAPVKSVNGQIGDVIIDTGVTSFNEQKGDVKFEIPYSDDIPETLSSSGSPGYSDKLSREDHVHPLPEVGGRNILRNSNTKVTTSEQLVGDYPLTIEPREGDTYTVQIKGKLGEDRTFFRVYNSNINAIYRLAILEPVGDDIYRATFKWVSGRNTSLHVYHLPLEGTSESTIEWIKLEKGIVPTDWMPAPEELGASLTDEQFQEIVNTVLNKYPVAEGAKF